MFFYLTDCLLSCCFVELCLDFPKIDISTSSFLYRINFEDLVYLDISLQIDQENKVLFIKIN